MYVGPIIAKTRGRKLAILLASQGGTDRYKQTKFNECDERGFPERMEYF